ncbi:hypothetical protein BKA70DRAFT_1472243 [Coprinopsis sp. MPI-PUGE-AT-0042]|nr:hypothetical protein BKA70DRAFT_1472243 [Coprinopsis sp. MPI-PUGE-AT-0042]
MESLDEAVILQRECLSIRPLGHPQRATDLGNLAVFLHAHFKLTGTIESLDESIALYREALSLIRHGHPELPISLNNLAVFLLSHFKQTAAVESLDESIASHQASLALLPLGHPHRPLFLRNLAKTLRVHFKLTGSVESLDGSKALFREAQSLKGTTKRGVTSRKKRLRVGYHHRLGESELEAKILELLHGDPLVTIASQILLNIRELGRRGNVDTVEAKTMSVGEELQFRKAPIESTPASTSMPVCITSRASQTTSCIAGTEGLHEVWERIAEHEKVSICTKAGEMIKAVRQVQLDTSYGDEGNTFVIEGFGGQPLRDGVFFGYTDRPFKNTRSFYGFVLRMTLEEHEDIYKEHSELFPLLPYDAPIVLKHSDLNFSNTLVKRNAEGVYDLAAIIDWERASWMPRYWDYCRTKNWMKSHEEEKSRSLLSGLELIVDKEGDGVCSSTVAIMANERCPI